MRILDRSVYVGPSLYARFPVIRLELDLGELEAWPTGRLGPAFVDALAEALPGLAEHGCSYREPGGFLRRMREGDGTWLGHVLEHVAIELQNIAGEEVTFGKTRSAGAPGVYTVVYEYVQRDEGIAAGELALRLLCSLLPESLRPADSVPEGWSWPEARDQFIRFAQRRALGPSTASLVRAAEERRHPVAAPERPVAGAARPRQVPAAHPGHRHRAARRTSRSSWPATRRRPTRSSRASGCRCRSRSWCRARRQAVRAARRIGFPVVTKPYNGNHGRGISIRLTTDEEVAQRLSGGARSTRAR